jgi:hypothetical protein
MHKNEENKQLVQNDSCKFYPQKLSINLLLSKLFYTFENKMLQNYVYLSDIVTLPISKM